ncbi:MAG: hypothetical protein IJ350_00220 [Clostridia bacterium]|nr:hypothetical protein [Clostridia bacterium]
MDFATELRYSTNLDSGVQMTPLKNSFLSGDQDAHRFIVSCFRSTSRQPVDLTGAGMTGYFIRADQSTVVIDGKVEDNCAVLTLPAACYAKEGRFSLVIKASLGDVIHTILWAEGAISQSHTGAIIDPGEVVPTLDELLAQIAAMEIATSNANTAAENANQAAADATNTANAAATQAVEIATAKGNEAVQIATEQVEAQNKAIVKIATDLDAKLLTKAPAIECEASGSLVTVTDAAAQPAVQLVTHIEPVQEGEGDPSPDNVRPISGLDSVMAQRAGRNLFPGERVVSFTKAKQYKLGVPLKPGVYTISGNVTSSDTDSSICLITLGYGVDGVKPMSVTFDRDKYVHKTFEITRSVVTVNLFASSGNIQSADDTVTWTNLQIEPGSVATAYEPYQGQTLTADLPETVYGGTLDWGTGVLTVDRAVYTVTGDEKWSRNTSTERWDCKTQATHSCSGSYEFGCFDVVCSHAKTTRNTSSIGAWMLPYSGQEVGLRWRPATDDDFANVDELKAYLAEQYAAGTPMQYVYKIATPYTIQLTPQQLETLKGTNNVWSDCGDTSLVYVADSKMYIDNKFAELEAAILSQGANV